ncbi:type II toxin-antitoxin system mRNA interferase toxin, RelE/StbE family [Massilia sp. CCM 8695]|uniref:Type II toxin-antitoxin system mRNA interferase toxin, RelE/StbE family n=1 Tax=Massilia frigida TaxID=2609281 RepID=A0ABX0N7U0_9BURK|nr:type II toxin-antitoxin system YafQ family toxin [Massilia frigida]NHZ78944.1 type II toxin-antitoxin system mRNA interferase toxin, RelE/StbE family [Massilia frigida]
MTLKKPAANRRTTLPRQSGYTKRFLQDWSALPHSGRYDMTRLKQAMMLLIANDGPLPAQWHDHSLSGKWERHRECHIGGDFLLVYLLDDSGKCPSLVFSRCGTHAEIFG